VEHSTDQPLLGERFSEALRYALEAHRTQLRKGTRVPYASHLLGVCALVLEHGADEDVAIAALLHDVAEDQGGEPRLADVRARFGERVARIVAQLSDSLSQDSATKAPWKERKLAYLDRLRHDDTDALLVSAADKVHNARAIVASVRAEGIGAYARFGPGKADPAIGQAEVLWYYESVRTIVSERLPGPLAQDLDDAVNRLRALSG